MDMITDLRRSSCKHSPHELKSVTDNHCLTVDEGLFCDYSHNYVVIMVVLYSYTCNNQYRIRFMNVLKHKLSIAHGWELIKP